MCVQNLFLGVKRERIKVRCIGHHAQGLAKCAADMDTAIVHCGGILVCGGLCGLGCGGKP